MKKNIFKLFEIKQTEDGSVVMVSEGKEVELTYKQILQLGYERFFDRQKIKKYYMQERDLAELLKEIGKAASAAVNRH